MKTRTRRSHAPTFLFPDSSVICTPYSGLSFTFPLLHGLHFPSRAPLDSYLDSAIYPFLDSYLDSANRLPQLRHRRATGIDRHRTGFGHGTAMRVIREDLLLNLDQ